MVMKYNDSSRKEFRLLDEEIEKARQFAAASGVSLSGLVAGWISALADGTMTSDAAPAEKPKSSTVQVVITPEKVRAAEERVRRENGVSLRDAIRHEIAQIDDIG